MGNIISLVNLKFRWKIEDPVGIEMLSGDK